MGEALTRGLLRSIEKASPRTPFFVVGFFLALFAVYPAIAADDLENLRQTNPQKFLQQVLIKAWSGDVAAEMVAAEAYENGQYGAVQNYDTALQWYKRAADDHNSDAELAIARIYQSGKGGVAKDLGNATAWLQMSANDGNAKALDFLGDSYLLGRGVDEDDQKAIELYHKAAKRDVIQSQVKLGGLYFNGQGLPLDYGAAYYWLRIARANPQHALFPDLDAAINNAATKITPAQREEIDAKVDKIVVKLHPPVDCNTSICIKARNEAAKQ